MCPVTFTALAITAGLTGTAAAVAGAAVSGALIGLAATAATNLITGQSITSGLGKGALFGAIGGGISGAVNPTGFLPAGHGGLGPVLGGQGNAALGVFPESITAGSSLTATAAQLAPTSTGIALSGAATSAAGALTPDLQGQGLALPQAQQDFSGGQIRTTGSGGSQAAVSLAEAVTRTKQRKLSQADVSSLSVDTSSFASGGLQFA